MSISIDININANEGVGELSNSLNMMSMDKSEKVCDNTFMNSVKSTSDQTIKLDNNNTVLQFDIPEGWIIPSLMYLEYDLYFNTVPAVANVTHAICVGNNSPLSSVSVTASNGTNLLNITDASHFPDAIKNTGVLDGYQVNAQRLTKLAGTTQTDVFPIGGYLNFSSSSYTLESNGSYYTGAANPSIRGMKPQWTVVSSAGVNIDVPAYTVTKRLYLKDVLPGTWFSVNEPVYMPKHTVEIIFDDISNIIRAVEADATPVSIVSGLIENGNSEISKCTLHFCQPKHVSDDKNKVLNVPYVSSVNTTESLNLDINIIGGDNLLAVRTAFYNKWGNGNDAITSSLDEGAVLIQTLQTYLDSIPLQENPVSGETLAYMYGKKCYAEWSRYCTMLEDFSKGQWGADSFYHMKEVGLKMDKNLVYKLVKTVSGAPANGTTMSTSYVIKSHKVKFGGEPVVV